MARLSRFQRDFHDVHGDDVDVFVRAPASAVRQMPLAHWPFWARLIVLLPVAIALLGLGGLLCFVLVVFSWMMGTAFFGPFWGGCIAVFAVLLAISCILIGLFGRT